LFSGPLGTHYHISVVSRLLHVLKLDLLFNEVRGLTAAAHSPVTGEEAIGYKATLYYDK
jgi:hypothetical protein